GVNVFSPFHGHYRVDASLLLVAIWMKLLILLVHAMINKMHNMNVSVGSAMQMSNISIHHANLWEYGHNESSESCNFCTSNLADFAHLMKHVLPLSSTICGTKEGLYIGRMNIGMLIWHYDDWMRIIGNNIAKAQNNYANEIIFKS
ncbi:hypothetical protein ACJX0J_010542, partial [Zea mays]